MNIFSSALNILKPQDTRKKFLHVGCGPARKEHATAGFNTPDWDEIRFDIDPGANPDIIGTMTDMQAVESESVDAIFSSHNIEHLFFHEVPIALNEFSRVLKSDGFIVIGCPDLQSVCEAVAADKLNDKLYESGVGPITPLDVLYGHQSAIEKGKIYMAHKCGFTYSTLSARILEAGFICIVGGRRPAMFDLWALAFKTSRTEETMQKFAKQYLP
jgi:ubiquinone/menaquinone biosynthesis C-methylase UbiE